MALTWKKRQLICGLFTFVVESHGKKKWQWVEKNLAWSDNVDYETIELAQAACEKWVTRQVLKMIREVGSPKLVELSGIDRMQVAALMSKL
jgi:hypothetical protein